MIARAIAAGFFCFAATAWAPSEAAAYGFFKCDDGGNYTRTTTLSLAAKWKTLRPLINLHTVSFPSGSANRAAAQAAIARWNFGPQGLQYSTGFSSTPTFGPGDKISHIAFATPPTVCAATDNACAPITYSCSAGITEVDIVLQSTVPFTTSEMKSGHFAYGGGGQELRDTLIHELGHTLGLAHTANVYNVMGDAARHFHTNGPFAFAYPGSDDVSGAVALYGTRSGAGANVGVSHWRWCRAGTGTSPISIHCYVRVLDRTSGLEVPSAPRSAGSGERVYDVRRNQSVRLELTFENMGVVNHALLETGFYFSTDDNISTADLKLLTSLFNYNRGAPDTRLTNLVIPTQDKNGNALVTNRTYFLGAIADDLNRLSESDENNATYVPIRIVN